MLPMTKPTIVLSSDHAGWALKEIVRKYVESLGYTTDDLGVFSGSIVDYPDYIIPAAESVAMSRGKKQGIVFGGTGIGECIAANKVRGVRAALIYDRFTAKKCREHNNANMICLGGRTTTKDVKLTKALINIWLNTPLSNEPRYTRRIKEVERYESKHFIKK